MTRDPITVLIADDHPMFRDGIRVVLSAADDVALVGEAVDGEEVVRMAAELQPEVVIMDLNLPGRHGIEATRQVVTTSPHIGVLVLTMFDDDESVFLAMRAGASGSSVGQKVCCSTSITRTTRSSARAYQMVWPSRRVFTRPSLRSSARCWEATLWRTPSCSASSPTDASLPMIEQRMRSRTGLARDLRNSLASSAAAERASMSLIIA